MARRRCAWRTRLIADGVRAPVQPRGVLAKFEDLYAADGERQAAKVAPPGATVDGIRVTETRAGALRRGDAGLLALSARRGEPHNRRCLSGHKMPSVGPR